MFLLRRKVASVLVISFILHIIIFSFACSSANAKKIHSNKTSKRVKADKKSRKNSSNNEIISEVRKRFTNSKQKTQLTGVGHRNRRNRSIFKQSIEKKKRKDWTKNVYVRMVENEHQIQFYIPSQDKVISLSASSKKDHPLLIKEIQLNEKAKAEWISIEGIYGIYKLPSGPHLVLITNSEEIYFLNHGKSQFINLRKVTSMEMTPIPFANGDRIHKHTEERRQLAVLRESLKEHEFYFVPNHEISSGNGAIVQDVTHTLQRSFVHWSNLQRESQSKDEQKIELDHDANIIKEDLDAGLDSLNQTMNELDPILLENRTLVDVTNGSKRDIAVQEKSESSPIWLWSWFHGSHEKEPIVVEESNIIPSTDRTSDDEQTERVEANEKHWWSTLFPSNGESTDISAFQRPDSRFFWNEVAVSPFVKVMQRKSRQIGAKLACGILLDHVIPVTSAFVGIQREIELAPNATTDKLFAVNYDELLISRRSKFRAGTRFTKRGADGKGDVANYAETEQICVVRCNKASDDDHDKEQERNAFQEIYSHVQTRGSIPLRWSSPTDIKTYRPKVMIGTDPVAQAKALRNHIYDQLELYCTYTDARLEKDATLAFINLIDKHSDQGRLGRTFGEVMEAVLETYQERNIEKERLSATSLLNPELVSHVWFDFHAECRGGRWDRLKYLLDDVRPCLDSHGYFCAVPSDESTWEIIRLQNGVVRTNCMDCLDRTNVVQSMFGRYVLYQQFCDRFGLKAKTKRKLPVGYNVAFKRKMLTLPWSTGEVAHRLLWADNADAISRLYAGTPALKGDFTRTGKRTKKGALDDGVNSVTRFYLNNFIDNDRQEGMDLLTGHANFDTLNKAQETEVKHRNARSSFMNFFRKEKKLNEIALDSRLSLTWLPGDLQSHLRSAALSSMALDETNSKAKSEISVAAALRDLDRRAMIDDPWWTEGSDDEMGFSKNKKQILSSTQIAKMKTIGSGHVMGALIATIKAPITSAVAFLCFLLPGIEVEE